jgi:hypothetical protein
MHSLGLNDIDIVGRYDLNALFAKAFGDFTVNVQGLSRVGRTSVPLLHACQRPYIGCVLLEDFLLGAERSQR